MFSLSTALAAEPATISGELKQWHSITVTFAGPDSGETADPNPFRDYRLNVEFSRGENRYVVPGYYAADGDAAETGAGRGHCWRVHFAAPEVGEWAYRASFRTGSDVAVSGKATDGKPLAFDGAAGKFTVGPTDKTGRDHRAKGALRYVGEHYLQFAATGEFFLKGGADSPENFLAYAGFDGESPGHQGVGKPRQGEASLSRSHKYAPHERDWREGDPTWRGDKGKSILGALNYLASKGMNSVYFLTMNVGGDGKDVWPWIDPNIRDRFDCSKLDQWEVVFSHMDSQGLLLHVITQETENDQLLDGGQLGLQRRLYYRELIARFGHHLAVVWNLGEENTNTDGQRKDFARFINELDPYGHPVVVHTYPGKYNEVYEPLLGYRHFHGPSLQMGNMKATHAETLKWVRQSAESRRPWMVCLDEIGPADTGVKPDADDPGHEAVRHHALWGNLMAGGGGVEWYFGYKFAHNDLDCEDWRSREALWDQTRYALEFFQQHLPFTRMQSDDGLTTQADDYCFARDGEVYAVYLPEGGSTELRLPEGDYTVKWYDPRRGGPLQNGTVRRLTGRGSRWIGEAPAEETRDWVVLIRRSDR
ncbi:MAG: DUF5060 domain-containing protein [Pirellulales bacterium]|nr:DUF5060 domain-containing protein [Pirellulales bacterium]